MLPRNGTGAIIISPTRELAMQIFGVLREIMEEYPGQTCGLVSNHFLNAFVEDKQSDFSNWFCNYKCRLWEAQTDQQNPKS